MEVFEQNHAVPFSKMLTFYRTNPFSLTASYSYQPPTYPTNHIGIYLNILKLQIYQIYAK